MDQDDPSDGSRWICEAACSRSASRASTCGWIKTIHRMDRDGFVKTRAHEVLAGLALADGSRRSIGWIEVDLARRVLAKRYQGSHLRMDWDDPSDGSKWIWRDACSRNVGRAPACRVGAIGWTGKCKARDTFCTRVTRGYRIHSHFCSSRAM